MARGTVSGDSEAASYGESGPWIVALHGGPGAPGSMAPVARRLARSFRVLAPEQRRAGAEPLGVAQHVADLHALTRTHCKGEPFALVGHSWGAMLALAFGAKHPRSATALVLIGCGTFDSASRGALQAARSERMDGRVRQRLAELEQLPDPDQRLAELGRLYVAVDSVDVEGRDPEIGACDARAHRETWADMLRLQEASVYPRSFAAIGGPILMLHGASDPHPGPMIRRNLAEYLPQLEYCELERCGHYPWLEREASEAFFERLEAWLTLQFGRITG